MSMNFVLRINIVYIPEVLLSACFLNGRFSLDDNLS